MKKTIKILSIVLLAFNLQAQGPDVIIEGTGIRQVEPAYRINEQPMIIDTNLANNVIEYPLLLVQHQVTAEFDTISAAKIKSTEKLTQLYSFYAKVGIGTELMPLGELYYDSKRSRKFIYGAHAKHLSNYGNFKNYAPAQFDRSGIGIYGGINERWYSLRGDLNYRNQGLHYYGLRIPTDSIPSDSIAQRYNDLGGKFSFSSHKKDSAKVNYTVGVEYNWFSSRKQFGDSLTDWRGKENFFGVTSSGWYKLGKEVYAAEFNVRYNGYKYGIQNEQLSSVDTAISLNNTVINFKPTISTYLKNDRFKAVIGADVVINAHLKTKAHIYPVAEVKYSMFNDIFIPYVGLRGEMKQVTYKSLTLENEFVRTNPELRNENTVIDVYGGIKGTLSKSISFNANVSYSRVKDKALFVTDIIFSPGNKFVVIYDTMNVLKIEGAISYQLNKKLKIDGIGRYNSYELLTNTYAWNLPQLQFIVRGHYNLFDKFMIDLDLNLEQGRRALVYDSLETNVTLENGQLAKPLGFIADVNLGLEYRYNKRISAFLQLNNLASQRYMRWYNYPVQIFQVMGGVTFRF